MLNHVDKNEPLFVITTNGYILFIVCRAFNSYLPTYLWVWKPKRSWLHTPTTVQLRYQISMDDCQWKNAYNYDSSRKSAASYGSRWNPEHEATYSDSNPRSARSLILFGDVEKSFHCHKFTQQFWARDPEHYFTVPVFSALFERYILTLALVFIVVHKHTAWNIITF